MRSSEMSVDEKIINRAAHYFREKRAKGWSREKAIKWATDKAFLYFGVPYPPYRDKVQVYSKLGERGNKKMNARRNRAKTPDLFPETVQKAQT